MRHEFLIRNVVIFFLLNALALAVAMPAIPQVVPNRTHQRAEPIDDYQIDPASARDAYKSSTNQIVIHAGDGVVRFRAAAEVLRAKGYPVTVYRGGPANQVECFVDRKTCGIYNQKELDEAMLSITAAATFDAIFGKPKVE